TSIGNSQKTIAGKSSPYLSKLVFWLAQANEPLSPRLQSRVVDWRTLDEFHPTFFVFLSKRNMF
ncbi:MAG: hypothetical protein SOI51_05845, partial [Lactobacillus amylovorus]